MPLCKARWLAGETTFTVAGPPGTRGLVEDMFEVHDYMRDRLDLTVREVEPGSFELAGFDVEAMETRHSMYCLAYRFTSQRPAGGDADEPAPTFPFSGDSEAFPELVEFADGAAVFAHDCSFPDEVDVSNHPTPAQLGEVLAGHDYGTVYLTHLYPHTEGRHEEMLESIRERYDGDVRVADDGLSVTSS
jgi:ribonuclease BN (tRNA processing enzyme)